MEQESLMPCPFCGDVPRYALSSNGYLYSVFHRCNAPVARTIEITGCRTKGEAIRAWNDRMTNGCRCKGGAK